MTAGLMFVAVILAAAVGALSLAYAIRVALRIIALRTSVRFLAIEGTRGRATVIGEEMYKYMLDGKVRE